jgi:hypothetical protein
MSKRLDHTASRFVGSANSWDRWDRLLAVGFTLAAGGLVLPNLGDRCLWQDEAECALVARGILRTGLPRAWDGRLLVTNLNGLDATDTMVWSWHPWAMHYLAAAGMWILGQNALGARLPFALLGCLSIGLTFAVARRVLRDRPSAILATLVLLSSVQYLLFMRQCRYYAILPLAVLLAVWGYVGLPRRRGAFLLIGGMVLLFHASYVSFACVAPGLAAHALWRRRDRQTWLRLTAAAAATAALTLPWILAMGLGHFVRALGAASGVFGREPFDDSFFELLSAMNELICPWVLALGLVAAAVVWKLRVRGLYALVACMAMPPLLILPGLLWPNPRYLVYMFPLGAIVIGACIREVHLRNRLAGGLLAIILIGTHLVAALPSVVFPGTAELRHLGRNAVAGWQALRRAALKSEWAGYLRELREPFTGPNEAITRFLNARSRPDDIVYANFEPFTIMFHTNRRCAGLLKGPKRDRPGWERLPDYLFNPEAANWLVIRPCWPDPGPPEATTRSMESTARLKESRWVCHTLDVREIRWGNRPLLRYHYFQSPGPSRVGNIRICGLEPAGRPADEEE